MTAHLDTPCDAAAYKPTSSNTWLAAIRDVFAALHDIQWRAPWEDENDRASPN